MLRIKNYFNEIYLHIYLENGQFQDDVLETDFAKDIIDFVLDFNEEKYRDDNMRRKINGIFPYNANILSKEGSLDEDHLATVRELAIFEDQKMKLFYNHSKERYDQIKFICLKPFNITVERLPKLEIPVSPLLKIINNQYIQLSINFPDVYQEVNNQRKYITNNFKSNMDFYENTIHLDDKVSKLSGSSNLIPFLGVSFFYGKELQEVLLTIVDRYFKYDTQSYNMRCLYGLRKGNLSKKLIDKFINFDRDSYFIKSRTIPNFSNPEIKDSLWYFSPSTTLIAISDLSELERSFIYSRVIEEFAGRMYILNYSTLNNINTNNIEILIERKKELVKLSEQRLLYKNSANVLKDILDYLFLKIYNIDNLIDLTSEKIDLELTISESKKNDINSQLQNTLGVLSLLLSTSPIYEFIVKPTIILLLDSINTLLVHFYKVKIQYRQYDNIITLFGFILTLLILYRILRNILPNLKSLIYNRKKRS
ncbi:hypothetical protein [Streptococcus suis]|uniref:Uncharacterized protein n=2 Tax=Streptococcus suis TaxID=1307 RepID=A0AAD0KX61_STRSU|nr:hypothetical protein [Streptococcus suis]AWX94685.1 hypothetical protein BKM66_00280 [Streptococcus suis]AWX96571.1 hypothetical protein BKM67_00280 [Streptococcus suis]MBS8056771.1 hypothetical protein [Streptococcus suis]MCL4943333.1 hypothetical protein [Streptococcus suis]MDX4992193.1 hypothetical protein [Streptococcus suis]